MTQYFGLPIFVGIVMGILFPFLAIQVSTWAMVFLIVLMVAAGLSVRWSGPARLMSRAKEVGLGLLIAFVFIPILLYVPASLMLDDQQFLYGFVFASLCPIAMVAPYFSRIHGGDDELAMLMVVTSMLLCPVLIPLVLVSAFSSSASLSLVPLTRYMIILIILPTVIGIVISRFLPRLRVGISRYEGLINSLMLALLVFSLFGTVVGKLNTSYTPAGEIVNLGILVFIQDFGALLVARHLPRSWLSRSSMVTLVVCISMKNVAIAAGVLLIYDPRASFSPAMAFMAHAFLFSLLAMPAISSRIFNE